MFTLMTLLHRLWGRTSGQLHRVPPGYKMGQSENRKETCCYANSTISFEVED